MRVAILWALCGFVGMAVVHAQVPLKADPVPPSWNQTPGQNPLPNVDPGHPHEDAKERLERQQRDTLNSNRQKEALSEVKRLSQLSKELADELAAADANKTLSAGAPKKVDEIIKLAKSVKEKMHRY